MRRLSVDKTIDQARAGYAQKLNLNLGNMAVNISKNRSLHAAGSETLTRGEVLGITGQANVVTMGFYTK